MMNHESLSGQPAERNLVDTKYTWKLEDIYLSDEAWQLAKEKVKSNIDKIESFKGTLSGSPGSLLAYLEFSSEFGKEFTRVYSYASMKSDQDVRNSQYLAMMQELRQLSPIIGAKSAFAEPEILAMEKEKIEKFIATEAGLQKYQMYLLDLFRSKEHTLSEKEEKILAQTSALTGSPYSIYSIFTNSELPYPEVTLSDGSKATLNQAGFARYRAVPNRADRELVFQTYWTAMSKFQRTLAEQLFSKISADVFNARTRNYGSSLESALDNFNIPVQVYKALIENVNKNLPTFHRYLALRKRMMNLDTLKYSDLYAPVTNDLEQEYTYEEAHKYVVESMSPLGKEYQDVLNRAYQERWIDVMPTNGKRSGAYSNGSVYDVHPYILLNYNKQYNDVSTYTHELGHTMHSYFSNKTQPYPTARYSIFVAEVASTFNEVLLNKYMVGKMKDDQAKLSLLMSRLDGFKGTLFRQTQFAEFELAIHERAEEGKPLTSDDFTRIYGDILKKYYGHEQGICVIKDLYTLEWSSVPHFYYNFYVYQYATSFTASAALAEKVLNKENGATEKYMKFLSSGGSDYPIELLKGAGVDMTTGEPFEKAIASMNQIMDEIEKILDKK
ncbi:MAG: oligoendopeptidase F [Bacteroidetes bacterium]|nr:oligoendopeptidase F [Bacteroidota bacterium]